MFLINIQQSIARHLTGHPFFAGTGDQKAIPVFYESEKTLKGKMDLAMGKLGICVFVWPMGGTFSNKSSACQYFDPARFVCRVRENPTTNRGSSGTGQPAAHVAEAVAQALLHFVPTLEDGTALGGGGIIPHEITPGQDNEGIEAYDFIFEYAGGLSREPERY